MKMLLTGKTGQVGFELRRALAPLGEIVAVDQAECDLSDPAAIRELVAGVQPDVIVNPAAYTAVDKAESDDALAIAVNGIAPGILGEVAAACGALVIHFSTDYVFDGDKARPYVETDTPNPQSVYGRSKLAGELALQASGAAHVILRTSWVVGAHGGNFAKTMLRLAADRASLSVVADQWGAPTSAALLADMAAHLVRQWQRDGAAGFPGGVYHCVAGGETNWCDYARFVIDTALAAGKPLKLTGVDVKAIATVDYPTPAKRPANSRLDTRKFRETFGLELPYWKNGVKHILEQILEKP